VVLKIETLLLGKYVILIVVIAWDFKADLYNHFMYC